MDGWLAIMEEGHWGRGPSDLLATLGPWLLAVVWAGLLLRAARRRHRYRAVDVLTPADCERVRHAVVEAERRTVGEIVPVVVERADPHPGAAWLVAALHMLLGSLLLMPVLPWDQPLRLLALQALMGGVGFGLARWLPDLTALALPRRRAEAVAREQALQEFFGLGLQKTEAATGVLLFVSLLEHQVVVLGDEGIDRAMGPEHWAEVAGKALEGVVRGDLAGGLVAAVEEVGQVLEQEFPWTEGDRNELPDRLVIRRE